VLEHTVLEHTVLEHTVLGHTLIGHTLIGRTHSYKIHSVSTYVPTVLDNQCYVEHTVLEQLEQYKVSAQQLLNTLNNRTKAVRTKL
jgi:hypothetical protein